MRRTLLFLYSLGAYALFLVAFLYLIAFLADLGVPRSVDSGLASGTAIAFAVDVLLVAAFGLQHSIMARGSFKRWLTGIVPAPVERSTYVLASTLVLVLLMWQWRPLPAVAWDLQGGAAWLAWTVCGIGWATVLVSTFLIDHFDLFGLRQTWVHLRDRPLAPPHFRMTLLYRLVRHPIMLGFLLAFWATPHMTAGHLLFAVGMTLYIAIGVAYEERDLVRALGQDYVDYRRHTPAFIPGLPGARSDLPVVPDESQLQPGARL